MDRTRHAHWDEVYRTKAVDSVSWYQPRPEPSLEALDAFGCASTAAFIDIGAGASRLVDHLVARGWSDLTVLDIAAPALEVAKARLGAQAAQVRWQVADITQWRPDRIYDIWHDRAVLHFLTEPEQRAAYVAALEAGTAAGALVIIATFALDGPERCSGLVVQRYSAEILSSALGDRFALQRAWGESHATPGGGLQSFQWCAFRRV